MQKQVVINNNGTTQNVELISFFELINIQKKYLFYTLNEKVENGLVKMYATRVANFNNNVFELGEEINDEEWTNLKNVMKTILTGGNDTNVKYLNIN